MFEIALNAAAFPKIMTVQLGRKQNLPIEATLLNFSKKILDDLCQLFVIVVNILKIVQNKSMTKSL
jgi:hypothetical protein